MSCLLPVPIQSKSQDAGITGGHQPSRQNRRAGIFIWAAFFKQTHLRNSFPKFHECIYICSRGGNVFQCLFESPWQLQSTLIMSSFASIKLTFLAILNKYLSGILTIYFHNNFLFLKVQANRHFVPFTVLCGNMIQCNPLYFIMTPMQSGGHIVFIRLFILW